MLANSVGLALLVLLDTLAPAERVAFVLHDMFGVSFNEIAPIVEAAARPRLIDGRPGAVWASAGRPRVVFAFTVHRDKITAIDMIADPGHVRGLNLVVGDW